MVVHTSIDKDQLRAAVDPQALAEALGLEVRKAGAHGSALCPVHGERSPSFHIYQDPQQPFHCFGCGWHPDIFEFVQTVAGCDFRAALEIVRDHVGGHFVQTTQAPPRRQPKRPARIPLREQRFGVQAFLGVIDAVAPTALDDGRSWVEHVRGIPGQTLDRHGGAWRLPAGLTARELGEILSKHRHAELFRRVGILLPLENTPKEGERCVWSGNMVLLPSCDQQGPCYLRARTLSPHHRVKYKGMGLGAGTRIIPYGLRQFPGEPGQPLVLLESQLDVLAMEAMGYRALALLGRPGFRHLAGCEHTNQGTMIQSLLPDLREVSDCMVLPDNDPTANGRQIGRQYADNLVTYLGTHNLSARVVDLKAVCGSQLTDEKDPNEFLLKGWVGRSA